MEGPTTSLELHIDEQYVHTTFTITPTQAYTANITINICNVFCNFPLR